MDFMKTVAFVPIKLNNERLPNKNTLPLGDKPLCTHLLETLVKVKQLDEIYVFCSQPKIQEYLPDGVKFLQREPELDEFTAHHYDIVGSFINKIDADIYVNAHVTNPFLKAETIESGITAIKSNGYDSLCVLTEIRGHLWKDEKPFNFTFKGLPRTQDLTPLYSEVGLFMYKKEVFINTGTKYGDNIFFIHIDKIESHDINYHDDYLLAQAIYASLADQSECSRGE